MSNFFKDLWDEVKDRVVKGMQLFNAAHEAEDGYDGGSLNDYMGS